MKNEYSAFASYGENNERESSYIIDELHMVSAFEEFTLRNLKNTLYSNWIIFSFKTDQEEMLWDNLLENLKLINSEYLQDPEGKLKISITIYSEHENTSLYLNKKAIMEIPFNAAIEINYYYLGIS